MFGISAGTIKAIEHGLTDPRLSTLRRLARTFKAHNVEFLFEGRWTAVLISTAVSRRPAWWQPATWEIAANEFEHFCAMPTAN